MGEYATYKGSSIKIGTCESMYYLRDDQRSAVSGYSFDAETLGVIRFRFPFPDEDQIEPGAFEDYDRGVRIPGWQLPADFAGHYSVQFKAEPGYLLSLPCPEQFGRMDAGGATMVELAGGGSVRVGRNGWSGGPKLMYQGHRDGCLASIVGCGSCGALWRLDHGRALEVADAFMAEAERTEWRRRYDDVRGEWSSDYAWELANSAKSARQLKEIARRVLAGYVGQPPAVVSA